MTQDQAPSQNETSRRLGPRPLPLHLITQASTLMGLRLALPSLRNGSFAWKPHLAQAAEQLRQEAEAVEPEVLAQAIDNEFRRRFEGFAAGVEAYRDYGRSDWRDGIPVVWRDGTSRLLDYSQDGAKGPAILVVPSLVNRAYVLDLMPRRSLMRYLASKGFRPYLIDWDAPGEQEMAFGLGDYIDRRLSDALDVVCERAGRPMLIGYCMGGLMALALATRRQQDVTGMVALATPWDFHQPTDANARIVNSLRAPLEDAMSLFGALPVDLLQTFFTLIDPSGIERKYRRFADIPAGSSRAREFVALEDWVNDGVPLAAKVAQDCLFGWYGENQPARGLWTVSGRPVRPQDFQKPALALIPAEDRIVPPASALALANALPNVKTRVMASGHVSMVTGPRAGTRLYGYIARWLMANTGEKTMQI